MTTSESEPLAYGHLDQEEDIVWLGIATVEKELGKGYGKQMLAKLIDFAKEKKIKKINLSVDFGNLPAIALYSKFGFKAIQKKCDIVFYELEIEHN